MKLGSRMVILAGLVIFSLARLGTATGGDTMWYTDLEKAKAVAAQEHKDILVDFTGSDWCGWCIKLSKEVFSQPEFRTAAQKDFVFVEVDFPNNKSKLTPEAIARNEQLSKTFGVKGFPTIFLLDAQGQPYAQTGYQEGGATAYLSHLAELRKVKDERDALWTKAKGAKGIERAKLLAEGLKCLDSSLTVHYASVLAEIKVLDPKDSMEFIRRTELARKMTDLENALDDALEEGPSALNSSSAMIDEFIKSNKVVGEDQQRLLMRKLDFYPPTSVQAVDGALRLLDQVIAVDPGTETAKKAAALKPRVEAFKQRLLEPSKKPVHPAVGK